MSLLNFLSLLVNMSKRSFATNSIFGRIE